MSGGFIVARQSHVRLATSTPTPIAVNLEEGQVATLEDAEAEAAPNTQVANNETGEPPEAPATPNEPAQPPTAPTETPAQTAPNKPPTPTPQPEPAQPAAQPQPSASTTVLSSGSSYSFVNNLRQENSVATLARSPLLESSAIAYGKTLADDCGSLVHMNLTPLLGQNINGKPMNTVAENLGYNQSVSGALTGLENSSGHFANMIDSNFDYIGIGVIQSNSPACPGRVYVVMQFGGV